MPSRVDKGSSNHLEFIYEAPFNGVASDNDPTVIDRSQFVQCQGLQIKDGKLITSSFNDMVGINVALPSGANPYITFSCSGYFIILDIVGNAYIYNPSTNSVTLDKTNPIVTQTPSAFRVINGSAYIWFFATGNQAVYTPTVSYVAGTTYVGGLYTTVIDGYLLTACSNQPTDSPAVKLARVNWSSPYAFTTFDPAVDRAAGFNVLADAQDTITGLLAQGNVGYAFRSQGITQLTPTGVAIQPFDFTTLNGEDFGIGLTYPDTLSAYGNMAAFANNTGIYLFSSGSIQDISGSAKSAILNDMNLISTGNFAFISGCIYGSALNSNKPDLNYSLAIGLGSVAQAGNQGDFTLIVWTYNLKLKTWTRKFIGLGAYIQSKYGTGSTRFASFQGCKIMRNYNIRQASGGFIPAPSSGQVLGNNTVPYIIFNWTFAGGVIGIQGDIFSLFEADAVFAPSAIVPYGFTLQCKQEEVRLDRKPTVHRLIVRAVGVGTINVNVGPKTWTSITLTDAVNIKTYSSSGVLTAEDPQVLLTSTNFIGSIIKFGLFGTYADGDVD